MMELWHLRGPWVAAMILTLMVLSPPMALVRDPRPWFLEQVKHECHFYNGTQRVRFLDRYFYNQEEYARFDSDVGEYRAVNELGRPDSEYWNSQEELLEQKRSLVDTYCRYNYQVAEGFTVQRRVEPQVTVYPTKTQPQDHHNLLVCSVRGFYPGQIEVRWFQNDQEEKAGVVSTGLIRNGDWTFQTLVMLETVPQSGEVYTCQVEHSSLTSPVRVEWSEWEASDPENPRPPGRGVACPCLSDLSGPANPPLYGAQSSSAQNKMLSGVGGFVLGLLFLGLGMFIYFRNQKGQSGLQPTGLLS